jgi:hypothetical protein
VASRASQTDPRGAFPDSSFKYTPLEHIETLLIAFIQRLFSFAPIGCYHWTPDETSEIYLSAASPVHVKDIGQRPAVTLTCGPIQFVSVGLDDMTGYHFDTGQKEKTVLVTGTMSINCSARVPIQSRQIAWIIWEHVWLLRELLLRAGFFDIGRSMMIGATSGAEQIIISDQGDEWVSTPLFCPFQFSRTSSFTPLGQQIVAGIEATIRAVEHRVHSLGAPTSPNSDLPYEVTATPPPAFAPAASDAHGGTPTPGVSPEGLPIVPHPLNPSQMVTVRIARGTRAGSRLPPGSSVLPITERAVEQSPLPLTDTQRFKV